LFGVSFVGVSSQHPILEQLNLSSEIRVAIKKLRDDSALEARAVHHHTTKDGVALNVSVQHPITKELLPLYVCGYVVHDYGCAAVMGVPAHDERDALFAQQHDIPCKPAVLVDNDTVMANSDFASGMPVEQGAKAIVQRLKQEHVGDSTVSYKIRDWLVSRQRYWGAPIPVVYCQSSACSHPDEPIAVPENQLPVQLPPIPSELWHSTTSTSAFPTLADFPDWVTTTCPKCGGPARRETDTMDTFVDSSWYFLRYPDARNDTKPFDKQLVNRMMPVDIYIGGIEHAVLHLLYSRFITRFLHHHEKLLDHPEPFTRLLTQGMVQAATYRDPITKAALRPEQLEERDGQMYIVGAPTDRRPLLSYEKMSKSKFNGIDPVDIVDKYGADTTRLFILFKAPPEKVLLWDNAGILGQRRWLNRLWGLAAGFVAKHSSSSFSSKMLHDHETLTINDKKLLATTFETISLVTDDIALRHSFNTV